MSQTRNPSQVKRRRVFYIPGYDPIHPRRYRELYRTESTAQAAISNYEIGQTPKTGKGPYGWHVNAVIDGAKVEADVEVLLWSDIVRDSMNTSIPATYWQLFHTTWVYIGTGALWRLMRLRKGPVLAALYRVGMLLGQLLISYGAGALMHWMVKSLLFPFVGIASQVVATGLSVVLFIWLMRWFKSKDGKFFAYYLMHDYAYGASSAGPIHPR